MLFWVCCCKFIYKFDKSITANARMAELVDALVSNTCGKPCRFDSGFGYKKLFWKEGLFSVSKSESNYFRLTGLGYKKRWRKEGLFSFSKSESNFFRLTGFDYKSITKKFLFYYYSLLNYQLNPTKSAFKKPNKLLYLNIFVSCNRLL